MSTPEQIAERFHEAYERLAPSFGYETRKASAKPWPEVPENNRRLMTAVAGEVLAGVLAELAASESLVAALQEQMARLAEQHAEAVAKAREEQREACATFIKNERYETWAEIIRATPLDSTPLRARIEELEAELTKERRDWRHPALPEYRARAEKAESALAAEVERHQATERQLRATIALQHDALKAEVAPDWGDEPPTEEQAQAILKEAGIDPVASLQRTMAMLDKAAPKGSEANPWPMTCPHGVSLAHECEQCVASLPAGPREDR